MSNKNDRWSALSLKDRADLMNMYITNGISDLKEMKKHYNSFSGEESFTSKVPKYPEVTIKEEPWADAYFKQHPEVSGMAIGAGLNGVNGPRRVIINPYSKNINKDAVLLNERSRHYMEESNFKLPKVTDEQMKKYEGTSYQNDTLNVGRTEAARFISGDKHLLTPEQIEYVNSFSGEEDTDDTKVQIPTTNIVTTHNYQEKLDEFNQYRQKAVTAFDSYNWDTYRENLNKSDSLGKEIAKYVLNEYEKHKGSPLNKGTWAGTSEAKEPEDINFLLRSNIREDGKDVTEWLKSYVNSEGFDRVRKNQESWWKKRHPYQKILFPIFGGINNNNELNRYQQDISNYADKMLNYVLDGYPEMSFSRPYEGSTFTFKPRIKEDKKFPFAFVQMHEFDHLFNDTSSSYKTINFEAMEQNTNTEEGHDSYPIEKHSDIIGLKYLLYKEGIYDARGGNDITPEQIGELRKKYPELRPLIQMDDEKAAWMINHVAQNTTNQESLDYINSDNIAAFGGNLNSFSGEENTTNKDTIYYDDTYIEPSLVKAFKSKEDYNKYYGEQFGKQVAKGMNNAAPYVLEAAMLPFDIAGIAEAPMLIYNGVKHVPKLMKNLKDLPTKIRISNKKLGKLFDFADTKMPIKEGSESVVYIGDDKVFKVPSESSPEMTLDELVEFNKNYISKRNTPPHTAPLTVEGVVKGSTKGKYYPVYSQQKLNIVGEDTMPFWEWEKHRTLLDEKMAKSGWPDIGGAYYNKDLNLHVGDIKPSNVAYDNKGNLLIIDGDVYGNGGKLNKFNTNYRILSGEEDTESTLSGESPSKLRQNIRKAKVNAMRVLRQMQHESPSKAIMKVFQDTDASRNFERNYYKNSYDDVAQDSFLFSKKEQENAFLNSGYIKGYPEDYGLVKKAVGDRNLPVYQTAKDDASREDLTVIGNISDIFFGDNKLTHAGHFPTAIYKDAEGNIYQKAWDLQDYGPDGNDSEGAYSYYDKIRRVGATLLDKIGNPVVRTTGFQKLDDSGIRALLINTKDKKLWEELIATSAKPIADEVMNSRILDAYEDYISTEASKKATHLDPNSERYIYDFENVKEEIRKNITFDDFKSNIKKYYSPETLDKKYFIF